MKIFDTHAHYSDSKYDGDREELFKKIYIEGVDKICLIGPNMIESVAEKKLCCKYNKCNELPHFFYSVGDHPDEIINDLPESEIGVRHLCDMERLCMESDGKVSAVAIGEIGLDYYGDGKSENTYSHQQEWFIAYINLAKKLHLPIVVHSREACKDTFDIIKKYAKDVGGVIHCFSYEKEIALQYIDMGFYIGVGGVVTFKNARKLKEVVESIPIEYIVTETDCPFLAPTPHRGERNESSYIKYVIDEIARLKDLDVDKVSEKLYNNANKMYGLI